MLQTLFHIPNEIGGVGVFGFGWLLGIWALGSVVLLVWLVRRQGFNADTWGYLPLLGLVAVVIWFLLPALVQQPDPESNQPGGLPIRGYGVMLLVAVVSGTALAAWRAYRAGLDHDMIFSLAFWMFVPGIVGARLFYVIEYWRDFLLLPGADTLRPLGEILGSVVNVAQGGLVVYGGFLGAVLGLLLFVRRYRLPLLAVCDLIAPSIMLGLALGRVGCLANGCCFGGVCDHPWAVTFPASKPPHVLIAPYESQVERGQMYGFRLGGDPKAPPVLLAVDPNSQAGKSGLQPGDRITRISGCDHRIDSAGQVHAALRQRFHDELPVVIEVRLSGQRPAVSGEGRGVKGEGRGAKDKISPLVPHPSSLVVTLPAITPVPARSLPVHPTQIYSLINSLLLCLLLLAYDPFRRRDGELFALMMSIYPIARYLLEAIRTDESPIFGTGLSISQNVSLLLLVCAAALWFYVLRQPRRTAFGQQD